MSLIDRAAYRVRQFTRTLRPHISEIELDDARRVLGPQLFPLFASMQPADQRHCLDVSERLTTGGCADTEMLQAALIHDAGKGRIAGAGFVVHHRVLFVMLEHLPAALVIASRFNRGIRSLRNHDQRTLEVAREYGALPGVIELLEGMAEGASTDPRVLQLVAADDAS